MMWNIRHGGGRRVPQILEVIHGHRPDILVLTDFRNNAVAPELCAGLENQRLNSKPRHPAHRVNFRCWLRAARSVHRSRPICRSSGAVARISAA
jgi:hypothetical protein